MWTLEGWFNCKIYLINFNITVLVSGSFSSPPESPCRALHLTDPGCHSWQITVVLFISMYALMGWLTYSWINIKCNKTKYFRLCLSDDDVGKRAWKSAERGLFECLESSLKIWWRLIALDNLKLGQTFKDCHSLSSWLSQKRNEKN